MVMLKQKQYPSKTTVNLIVRERTAHQVSRAACGIVILAVLVALFCKFAVIDRISAAARAEAAAAAAEQELAEYQRSNERFDEVRLEYERYFSSDLTGSGAGASDCMQVLGLMEEKLMPSAQVVSASFEKYLLTVQLAGIDLSQVSGILADLTESPLVESVEISNADTGEDARDARATVSMTIHLSAEGGEDW